MRPRTWPISLGEQQRLRVRPGLQHLDEEIALLAVANRRETQNVLIAALGLEIPDAKNRDVDRTQQLLAGGGFNSWSSTFAWGR